MHLPHHPDGLHPTEDFFDSFPFLLTDLISRMGNSSPVDGAGSISTNVLCNMWGRLETAQVRNKLFRIVGFIRPHCDPSRTGNLSNQFYGTVAFRRSCCCADLGFDDQSVPIFHHHMSQIAEQRFLPSFSICLLYTSDAAD